MSEAIREEPSPQSYSEFWRYYVSQHLNPVNRRFHFLGTSLALACLLAAVKGPLFLLLALPFFGYGPAWLGHFFLEKNRPATFRYPLWSLRGDFQMYVLMWRRKMKDELNLLRLQSLGSPQPATLDAEVDGPRARS